MNHIPNILFLLAVTSIVAGMPQTDSIHANTLRVDRGTGRVTWENTGFSVVGSFGYEIDSASGSLNPNAWHSIAEHGDADSGGSIDPIGTWDVWGRDAASVAEATFDGSFYLRPGDVFDLGTGLWRIDGEEDLEFKYFDEVTFELTPAQVEFFGELPESLLRGDYNGNGTVEQADLNLVLLNWGAAAAVPPPGWVNDLAAGTIDQDELNGVLLGWGDTAASLVPSDSSAAVPEPGTVVLLLIGLSVLAALQQRKGTAFLAKISNAVGVQ